MKKIHFIAVGGSIMHQLAIALKERGYEVTGSDDDFYDPARSNLEQHGLLHAPGWDKSRITPDLDAVILGMHAREDNPEMCQAEALGIPLYSFPEFIYEESKDKTRVVIGGSHGKTTITSMIMHVLQLCHKDFDFLVGAPIPGFNQSVKISDAPVIICEGDEYPASALKKVPKFLFYKPQIAVLSGIAWDHINVFPTFEDYTEQFDHFIKSLDKGTLLIYNETDSQLRQLVQGQEERLQLIPYRLPAYQIEKGTTRVTLEEHSKALKIFGKHNLQNLQAAALVCKALGINTVHFLEAIKSFEGASRRLERVYENENTIVFRDFAHAPSKVSASMQAVKDQFPGRRLVAVLELHTYSSLNQSFLPHYAHAMDAADEACVFYSPHALKIKRLPAVTPTQIREGFGRQNMEVLHEVEDLKKFIAEQKSQNANLLMMSSGSFGDLGINELIELWTEQEKSSIP